MFERKFVKNVLLPMHQLQVSYQMLTVMLVDNIDHSVQQYLRGV
jgi:hypothetical protein